MGVGQEDAGAGCCDSGSVGSCSRCGSSNNSINSICSSNSSTKNCSSNTDRGSKSFASSETAGTTGSDTCACSAVSTSNNTQSSSNSCRDSSIPRSCPSSANSVSASSSSSSVHPSDAAQSPGAGDLVLPALKITFYEAVLQQLISDNLLDTARSLASTLRLRSIAPFAKDHLYRVYLQTLFLPPAAAASAHLPSSAEVAVAEVAAAEANQAQGRGAAATYAGRVEPSAAAAALDAAAGPRESGREASPCDSDGIRVAASAGAAAAACATRQQSAVGALAAEGPLAFDAEGPLAFGAAAAATPAAAAAVAEMVVGANAQQDAGRSAPWSDGGAAAQFPPQPWVPLLTRAVLPPTACKSGSVRLLSYAGGAALDFSAAADTSGKPYTHTAGHSTQPELQQEQDQQQRGAAAFHWRRRRSSSSSVGSLRSLVENVLVEEVRASITFQAPCISAACSPDLRLVAGGGRDATVRIIDVAPTRSLRMRVYHGHIGPVTALALHPTRDLCFSGSTDCSVKIYDVSSKSMRSSSSAGLPIASFQDAHAIECLTVHPCGDFLYVGTTHPIIRLYDLQSSRCFTCLAAAAHQQERICDLRCSADGAILASASADGTIHFFDAVDGKLVNRIPAAHSGMPVTSVRWSRTGRYLLSSGVDGQSRIWDVRNGKQVLVLGEGIRGRSPKIVATFLSNEAYIAQMSVGVAGGLRYYRAHTGSEVASKSSTGVDVLVNALESAPLEMTLVTAGSDAKTRLVYVRESEAERDLELSTA